MALPALADAGHRFDVVYLDPPYDSPLYEPLLEELAQGRLLEREAWWWPSTSTSGRSRRE